MSLISSLFGQPAAPPPPPPTQPPATVNTGTSGTPTSQNPQGTPATDPGQNGSGQNGSSQTGGTSSSPATETTGTANSTQPMTDPGNTASTGGSGAASAPAPSPSQPTASPSVPARAPATGYSAPSRASATLARLQLPEPVAAKPLDIDRLRERAIANLEEMKVKSLIENIGKVADNFLIGDTADDAAKPSAAYPADATPTAIRKGPQGIVAVYRENAI